MKNARYKSIEKPELLAPVGSMEGLIGVLRAGADAVYLAGNRFGARAYADNFSDEDLLKAISICHRYGKKLYLTVNTLVKDTEIDDLLKFMNPLYENGLDGVIVQDLGVFSLFRHYYPELELHASTQMAITGKNGAEFLKKQGACRIVPARELSLDEIKEIKASTGLEIECFIHGAMCYCYSGMCNFSASLGERSGNRGRCAQPCRLPYKYDRKAEDTYCFSLKDMNTLSMLPELIEAGIDSFKIEGRMKRPEYAAGVTAIYREAIDSFFECGEIKALDHLAQRLASLYIRTETSQGYYHIRNGVSLVTLSQPAYTETKETVLEEIKTRFLGDEGSCDLPKQAISVSAVFITGQEAFLYGEVSNNGKNYSASVTGGIVDKASKRPISEQNIREHIMKTGDSRFVISESDVQITLSEDAFYPLGGINELRRQMVTELENQILSDMGFASARKVVAEEFTLFKPAVSQIVLSAVKKDGMHICVSNTEQLRVIADGNFSSVSKISIEENLYINQRDEVLRLFDRIASCNEPVMFGISLSPIRRNTDYLGSLDDFRLFIFDFCNRIFDISGQAAFVIVRNLEDYAMALSLKKAGEVSFLLITDTSLYAWNRFSSAFWLQDADCITLPLELTGGALRDLAANTDSYFSERIIYGYLPMMITAGCISKTKGKCLRGENDTFTSVVDRQNSSIPVKIDCRHCLNVIYNSVPLSLHNRLKNWNNSTVRLSFTIEDPNLMMKLLAYYDELYYNLYDCKKQKSVFPIDNYTTGHDKNGVL